MHVNDSPIRNAISLFTRDSSLEFLVFVLFLFCSTLHIFPVYISPMIANSVFCKIIPRKSMLLSINGRVPSVSDKVPLNVVMDELGGDAFTTPL